MWILWRWIWCINFVFLQIYALQTLTTFFQEMKQELTVESVDQEWRDRICGFPCLLKVSTGIPEMKIKRLLFDLAFSRLQFQTSHGWCGKATYKTLYIVLHICPLNSIIKYQIFVTEHLAFIVKYQLDFLIFKIAFKRSSLFKQHDYEEHKLVLPT